jgi:hypothetical protein
MSNGGTHLCPWSGSACDCRKFPYPIDGLIPAVCEASIVTGSISMVPLRKVSESAKAAYKQWLADEAARRAAEKEAQKQKHVGRKSINAT